MMCIRVLRAMMGGLLLAAAPILPDRATAQGGGAPAIVPQAGHNNSANSVAFSVDGRFAVSGGADHVVKLWDVATGKLLRSLGGHKGAVNAVAYSPDGKLILSGSSDKTLKLWDVATGTERRTFAAGAGIFSVSFSPDGRNVLAGCEDKSLKVWEIGKTAPRSIAIGLDAAIGPAAFSTDGRAVLYGSGGAERSGEIALWDLATARKLRSFPHTKEFVRSVALSPDGRQALTGTCDRWQDALCARGAMTLWDAATGKELRRFVGHQDTITSLAFSPDGSLAVSGSPDNALTLWDVAKGEALRSLTGHTAAPRSVKFSPDGRFILSGGEDATVRLWDAATGKEALSFGGGAVPVHRVAYAPDGRLILSGTDDGSVNVTDAASGRRLRTLAGHRGAIRALSLSPDGSLALSAGQDSTVRLWDVASARELRSFTTGDVAVSVQFSPDGKQAFAFGAGNVVSVWDVATGQRVRQMKGPANWVQSVALSPNAGVVAFDSFDSAIRLWDAISGKELRVLKGHVDAIQALAFSPDGASLLSASSDGTLKLWDTRTGRRIRSIDAGHGDLMVSVAFSPDGRSAISGSWDGNLKLWDLATGRLLGTLGGHAGWVQSAAFSPDGRFAVSGSADGTVRVWSLKRMREAARMMAAPDAGWLAMTPEGFFAASRRDTGMLALVLGTEATTIGQVHQSLFNPDLVREALEADPTGEVARAAEIISLDKVLAAGPPPAVVITSPAGGSRSAQDLVTITADLADRGGGIGRIEWRVNGVTAAVQQAPAGGQSNQRLSQTLPLDNGENEIEVIAYERQNLLASPPARIKVVYDAPAAASIKPKLHILAVGINAYVDKGGSSPQYGLFPPLNLAVSDAKSFAVVMRAAGAELYSEMAVTEVFDADATAANLDKVIDGIAAGMAPRDTFILYAASHGYSRNGRYYLIPQDYQGGADPAALARNGIGQERLQDWIGNRIKARKAVILLDSCESGALVAGYTQSRVDVASSEAAIGRLHEATGRPVLTAAASGKPAFEGYQGHGVFTFALIDALHHGDSNGDGEIALSELVDHVQTLVPKIGAALQGGGQEKGAAVVASRGVVNDEQSARFGSTGEDFVLGRRLK